MTDHAAIIASSFASSGRAGARRRRGVAVLVITAVVAALLAAVQLATPPKAHAAASTGSITLKVQEAMTVKNVSTAGTPITKYKWLINKDDTGDPGTISNQGTHQCLPPSAGSIGAAPADANTYADHCQWPSVRSTSGFAPIVAQGDQTDLSLTKTLDSLPNGKYLISVTADDHKIDGAHFTVNGDTQQVVVSMFSNILPLTTLRLQVFHDNMPVDATYEVDAESGANMTGFVASLTDVLGQVSTDYYGNPLCTTYKHTNGRIVFGTDGKPVIATGSTGKCVSDRNGDIVIPNLGPDRYAATVSPPKGTDWVQTTTLEGGHDHDIWQQEGETGFDTEQRKGAELVPQVQFGFVHPQALAKSATSTKGSTIVGNAIAGLPYIGGSNGQVSPETGLAGVRDGGPIPNAWIALSDLDHNDLQVYAGQADGNGHFSIPNVAPGQYQLSVWDFDQDYILWSFNVTVEAGQKTTDVGNEMIVGWFTHIYGKVFIDSNGNGRKDPGEQGVPRFTMTVRERDNSLMDQYTNTASTDDSGTYDIRETYPLGKFLVLEGFNTEFKTTGITYQGENDPSPTTQLGSMVDINFLPIIGLGGEIDWGVQPYDKKENGGIVGTVTYDTTRNELDPQYAATEGYQPGIPGVPVHLYVPQTCTETDAALIKTNCRQGYELASDGSIAATKDGNGDPIAVQDTYTSEEWAAPRGCTARQWDGSLLEPGADQQALPPQGKDANALCIEAPMAGVSTGASDADNGAQTVNGNYGFGSSKVNLLTPSDLNDPTPAGGQPLDQYAPLHCLANPSDTDPARDSRCADGTDYNFDDQPLTAQDYIVGVDIPNDPVDGKPMYKVTSEEDVNIFQGDRYLPQENFPPASVQAGQTQSEAGFQPSPAQPPSQQAGIISPCAGPMHTVHVTDPTFLAGGGSPFEGQDRPSCVDKLVTVRSGQATAPNFNLFTDVPIPTHFWGLTLNDLGLTLDKRSANYGEAQGLPYVPVGLYDWAGRLDYTTHTDFNGLYEALMPSTDTYNCPVPAGPCPNMYRFVGNDPGQPGALNSDYNPRFRTIATNFQAWPGLYTVTDEAPTQIAATALAPDTTTVNPTQCDLGATGDGAVPQLLAVDRPYLRSTDANRSLVIKGMGFGGSAGTVKLGSTTLTASAWSDTQITVTVPVSFAAGAQSLSITRADGTSGYNMLTEQIVGSANGSGGIAANPRIVEVGPGKQYSTVQAALEAANPSRSTPYWLVVVYPNAQSTDNPRGEYTENVIMHHRVHIQGVGPGGFQPDGTFVPGTILDGSGFNPDTAQGLAWVARLTGLTYSGMPDVPDAAVVTVLDDPNNAYPASSWNPAIDGLQITGGTQSDFPTNLNEVNGGVKTPYGATGALVTQGGGIYVHSHVRNLQITDNLITGNGGSYGGGIRVGTPYLPTGPFGFQGNLNTGITIRNNQIRDNGGTNLAGGIGLFNGSDGYKIDHNAICGNHSAEYGGALTAFGYQEAALTGTPGGSITNNRIWFNQSYDEGGAVMIAGELPATATALSPGTGRVTIDRNVIQANLANDDGGGIRLLQVDGSNITSRTAAQNQMIQITNNVIASNISAHEGGGLALDDAPFTNIVNDTIANNVTTATAITSDGQPAPAGLSTAMNSDELNTRLATLGSGFPTTNIDTLKSTKWTSPALLNDVFWDNRAGSFDGAGVCGIGGTSCGQQPDYVNNWDMGVADNSAATLSPTHSVFQDGTQVAGAGPDGVDPHNSTADPNLKDQYVVDVSIMASRSTPTFRQSVIVGQILPPRLMGDYHLGGTTSPAYGLGAANTTVNWGAWVPAAGRTPAHWTGWSYAVNAASPDIDGNARPGANKRYDAGADQVTP